MLDSGGYTMKCRKVKPNPWDVRHKRTVLGLGQANGSSSVEYCTAGQSAKLWPSGESFYQQKKEKCKKELLKIK